MDIAVVLRGQICMLSFSAVMVSIMPFNLVTVRRTEVALSLAAKNDN